MADSKAHLTRLASSDSHVRFDALKSMTGAVPDRNVRAMVVRMALSDKLGYNRLQAVKMLRAYWPESDVVRAYTAATRDEQFVAEAAIEILGDICDTQALGMLQSAYFSSNSSWLKVAVLSNLRKAPQQFLYDFVVRSKALHHRDEKVRAAMVALLGHSPNPTMKSIFLGKLKDGDARVRANAIEALGKIMSGVELARIVAPYAVADPSNRVRANSLVLMMKAGITKAADFVIHMARHSDPRWRASAAYAIRQVPTVPVLIPWARKLASDGDDMVVAQAEMALNLIGA